MRHYTPDERSRLISEWRISGKTRKAFAQEHGVSAASLATWKKRVDASAAPVKFHPLVVADAHPRPPKPSVAAPVAEVSFGALTVRIYAGITDEILTSMLATLRQGATC